MEQQTLLIIAASVTIVGMSVLFLVKPDVSPHLLAISGEVTKVSAGKSVVFITFKPADFEVVSFENLDSLEGNRTLYGRLQEYKGKVEFVVESYDIKS